MKGTIHVGALLVIRVAGCLITAVCSIFLLNPFLTTFWLRIIVCVCVYNLLPAKSKLAYLVSRRRPAAGKI